MQLLDKIHTRYCVYRSLKFFFLHDPERKTYDVLSILRGNGNEWYKILGKNDISKDTRTKEDTDSCWVTACGCRGAYISKNDY